MGSIRLFVSLLAGAVLLTSCAVHDLQNGSAFVPQSITPDHKVKAKCGSNDGVTVSPCPIKLVNNESREVTIGGPGVINSGYGEGNCYPYKCKIEQESDLVWKVTGYKCKPKLHKKLVFLGAISIYGYTSGRLPPPQGFATLGIKFVVKRCK